MPGIKAIPASAGALYAKYARTGVYTDCFAKPSTDDESKALAAGAVPVQRYPYRMLLGCIPWCC